MSKKATFRVYFYPDGAGSNRSAPTPAGVFCGVSFWDSRTLQLAQELVETGALGRGRSDRYRAVLATWCAFTLKDALPLHRSLEAQRAIYGDLSDYYEGKGLFPDNLRVRSLLARGIKTWPRVDRRYFFGELCAHAGVEGWNSDLAR